MNLGDEKIEVVLTFCYLGDTIGAKGGIDASMRARVKSGWSKSQDLLPLLTSRGLVLP